MLKMWAYTEGEGDLFIAESAEEADAMLKERTSYTLEELSDEHATEYKWFVVPGGVWVTIRDEDGHEDEKTVAEWCACSPKGHFTS